MVFELKGRRKSAPYGFTLVELLVSLVIVGLLASIAIGRYKLAIQTSKQRATMANMRNIAVVLNYFQIENGKYPHCSDTEYYIDPYNQSFEECYLEDIMDTITPPSPSQVVLNIDPRDAWGHPLKYETDGSYFIIRSRGRNGIFDGPISPETRHNFDLDIYFDTSNFTASPI